MSSGHGNESGCDGEELGEADCGSVQVEGGSGPGVEEVLNSA
jgi:hypothetical protein